MQIDKCNRFLANCSAQDRDRPINVLNNAIKDTDEIIDAGLVNIDTAACDPETLDIGDCRCKGC